ncbi:MAG: hypothetical protein WAN93_03075 [Solirubrobacteraceae bacterium]
MRLLAPAIAAVIVGLVGPPVAGAGTYPMYQCSTSHRNLAAGWSVFSNNTAATNVLRNTCSSGGPIEDYVSTEQHSGTVRENGNAGSQVGISLAVPASAPGVSIASISEQIQVSPVSGDDSWLEYGTEHAEFGGGEIFNGQGAYSSRESWSLPIGARWFDVAVHCSTDDSNSTCQFTEATHVPAISDVNLTLVDDTPPSLSNISGTLATAAAHGSTVTGTQTFSFTGKDADSGVLSATITLTPQSSGSAYTKTIPFSSECTYESWNACPLTETVSPFTVDTTSLKDGTYAVNFAVRDAAGNVASEALGTITTQNEVKLSSLGALPGPGTAAASSVLSVGAGAPNGTAASEGAELRLGASGALTRTFAHRAFRLTGRLLSAQGHPIGKASLNVLQQITGESDPRVITHAITRSDGAFAVSVPAGPSRLIDVAYRAFSADSNYTAQATIAESVSAGVRLHVTPRRTSPEGAITLTGTVQGPIPRRGTIVDLLVHYRGRWEPFRTPRTNSHGRFRVVYQFEGGVGHFPFRAEVPAGQAGFPFADGSSQVVNVSTS